MSRRSNRSAVLASVLVVLSPIASVLPARAEPASSVTERPAGRAAETARRMTLDDARAYARSHHLRMVAARQRLVAAERDADVPGAQWLPRVGAMAQLIGATTNNSSTTLLGVSTVDLPRIGATPISNTPDMQPYPSTAVAIGVRQQLYDFGRITAERDAAVLVAEADKLRVASTALDVDYSVEQSFYAVLAAVAIADASKAAFDRASQHRDLARANVQTGMRPPIELTRAEADVARYEAGNVRAEAGVHVARSVFAVAVGVDDVELDAAKSDATAAALPALDALLGTAETSPDVLEPKARASAQRAETRRLETQNRPSLGATAAISGRAGGTKPTNGPYPYGDGWLPVVPNYDVGVVFTWPILEPSWDRRADASRAREGALDAQADLAKKTTRAAIVAAYHDADAAARTLTALERGANAAKANYDQAENRFKVGLGTSTELADAQALRTEADIQLAIGRFQTSRTRAALSRATAEAAR